MEDKRIEEIVNTWYYSMIVYEDLRLTISNVNALIIALQKDDMDIFGIRGRPFGGVEDD